MTQAVETYRADYLRMKQAGNEVTSAELAAARGAYEEALENLSGADPIATDSSGRTALDLARQWNRSGADCEISNPAR